MSQDGQLVQSLQTLILDLPPSCIEFCPAYPDHFVVGTYDLQKDDKDQNEEGGELTSKQPQTRNGSLILFRVVQDNVYDELPSNAFHMI